VHSERSDNLALKRTDRPSGLAYTDPGFVIWLIGTDRRLVNSQTRAPSAAHPGYRADIDGLRAVAVLSVVGFHALPTLFPAGFFGVDIFFVISGYLITGIVVDSLRERRFSFLEFYRRRIQRIFPALLLVLAACLAAGWFLLIPDEFHDIARQVLASAGFFYNRLLWHRNFYFDPGADSKPLQHLWSLAVEEQFYIVWPVVLWLACRLRLNVAVIIAILAAGSFALNVADTFSADFVNTQIAFASSQTRAWELLLGGFLACTTTYRGRSLPFISLAGAPPALKIRDDVLTTTGIVLLASVLVGISPKKAYPGFWTLLPTIGTCLVIAAGPHAWVNSALLASRPCRFIGLISYPLYLWHWPLLSFARVLNGAKLPAIVRLVLVGVAIFLAWLTYQTVERPIRSSRPRPSKAISLLAAMLIIGSVAYAGFRYDPLDDRPVLQQLTDVVRHAPVPGYGHCQDPQLLQGPRLGLCIVAEHGSTDAALIGDSHAEDKFFGFVRMDREHHWALLGSPACPPVYAVNVYVQGDRESDCRQRSDRIIDWLDSQSQIKIVVLGFFGNYFLTTPYAADHVIHDTGPGRIVITGDSGRSGSRSELFFFGLDQAIAQLERAHKRIVVLIDLPEFPFLPRDCFRRQGTSECILLRSAVNARQAELRAMIAKLQRAHPGIGVFDPVERFCPQSQCIYTEGGQLLYEDSNHLSHYGSDRYAEAFSRWLMSR
jgi:peptidoglycan/LPS O-acetylase OafA/YrhL